MVNSLLFLLVNLAIFWVMYWAWTQDNLEKQNDTSERDRRG